MSPMFWCKASAATVVQVGWVNLYRHCLSVQFSLVWGSILVGLFGLLLVCFFSLCFFSFLSQVVVLSSLVLVAGLSLE